MPGVTGRLARRSLAAAHLVAALELAKDGAVTISQGQDGVVIDRVPRTQAGDETGTGR